MPRFTGTQKSRAAGQTKGAAPTPGRPAITRSASSGTGTLAELGDHCRAAQRIAEAHGEKLLGYLLSMAAEEGAAAAMRHKAAEAAGKPASPRSG